MTLDEAKAAIRSDPYCPRDATEEQVEARARCLASITRRKPGHEHAMPRGRCEVCYSEGYSAALVDNGRGFLGGEAG